MGDCLMTRRGGSTGKRVACVEFVLKQDNATIGKLPFKPSKMIFAYDSDPAGKFAQVNSSSRNGIHMSTDFVVTPNLPYTITGGDLYNHIGLSYSLAFVVDKNLVLSYEGKNNSYAIGCTCRFILIE